jgi:hypothetical protein
MKNKYGILILTAAILLSLASCQSPDVPSQGTAETTAQQTTAETTAAETELTETVPETTAPVLDGSFSTPDYDVTVIDGKCYLNFTDGNEAETTAQGDLVFGGDHTYLIFSSLAEMKQKLQENTLTATEINTVKAYFQRNETGFEICNVANLMTTVLPDGWCNTRVDLLGATYRIGVDGGESNPHLSGIMRLSESSQWDKMYADELELIQTKTNINHTTETFDGIPCEVYTYTTSTSTLKDVFLTIPGEDGKADINVLLIYVLDTIYPDKLTVSETISTHLYMYGETYSTYYDYTLLGLTEAPTVEWLSSFSIAPYVDNSDHVVS